ncbi:MAG: hypothetical protein IPG61_16880 [bacterium]|nr:hypothetical protein [bacterium]
MSNVKASRSLCISATDSQNFSRPFQAEVFVQPAQAPVVLPARSPPQLEFRFDQTPATDDWSEMEQTAGQAAGDGGRAS